LTRDWSAYSGFGYEPVSLGETGSRGLRKRRNQLVDAGGKCAQKNEKQPGDLLTEGRASLGDEGSQISGREQKAGGRASQASKGKKIVKVKGGGRFWQTKSFVLERTLERERGKILGGWEGL